MAGETKQPTRAGVVPPSRADVVPPSRADVVPPSRADVVPPSRAMADRDRYRPPVADEQVEVRVEGVRHPGQVLGRNGARVHVVFVKDGSRYRRWVDAGDVLRL